MVADIAIHKPIAEKGDDPRNHHAHILLTLRQATPDGLRPVKTREWNARSLLESWRGAWAAHQNDALRQAGRRVQVDHRSLVKQMAAAIARGDRQAAERLDRAPEIHVGPRSRQAAMEQRALRSRPLETGPRRLRAPEQRPSRRVVDYPRLDQGRRIDWLSHILLGNNERAKERVAKLDRQAARMRKKLDHWERQARFRLEGEIQGARFRWLRAKAAEEERQARERARQKQAHAAKRAAQVRSLIREMEMALVALRGGREAVLVRQRQLEGWTRRISRDMERNTGRDRLGGGPLSEKG